jgi:hypothetical protein
MRAASGRCGRVVLPEGILQHGEAVPGFANLGKAEGAVALIVHVGQEQPGYPSIVLEQGLQHLERNAWGFCMPRN